jgi:serine/threonine protein kinase
VLLTDFGISKHVSQRTTGGTPPYMAPEQFSGEKLTPQTDVYGLGVTLYEMLSGGQVPYRGESSRTRSTTLRDRIHWEVMNLPYPELEKYNSQVPRGVESAVRKALDKNPMRRFQTAIEFYNVVEQGAGGAPAGNGNGLGVYLPKESSSPQSVSSPPAVPAHQASTSPQVGAARFFSSLPRSYSGPFLFALQGEYEGLFIPLEQATFHIGRSSQGQLVLQERSVSRQHALIQITQRGLFLQDMGSKLGTYVNGQLVQGVFRLESGDVIQIGYEQVFEVHVR